MSVTELENIVNVTINTPISNKLKYVEPNLKMKHQHLLLLLKHENPKGKFTDDIIPIKCSISLKEVEMKFQKLKSACLLERIKEFKSLAKMIPRYDEITNALFIKQGLIMLIKQELKSPQNTDIFKFECIRILIGLIESSKKFHSIINMTGFIHTLHKFRRDTKDPILCKTYDIVRGLMKKYNIDH